MQKDFITVNPDSGGAGTNTITTTPTENTAETARSTSIKVKGGGMERTVTVNQAAAVVTWNYYFSASPTSLSFVSGGESKTVAITSYRKKVINGTETSTQEAVTFTHAITGTGFSKNTAGTTITAANNTGAARTGTVTYTQGTSGKTATVSLSQAAVVITWNYYLTVTPTSMAFTYEGESRAVTISSIRKQVLNGTESATQENVSYTQTVTGTGFSVNTSGTVISASQNTGNARTGSVTYTQATSGIQKSVSLSQEALMWSIAGASLVINGWGSAEVDMEVKAPDSENWYITVADATIQLEIDPNSGRGSQTVSVRAYNDGGAAVHRMTVELIRSSTHVLMAIGTITVRVTDRG